MKTTTNVYGVFVKTYYNIYGATFGPPFVFLHKMINRFKFEDNTTNIVFSSNNETSFPHRLTEFMPPC